MPIEPSPPPSVDFAGTWRNDLGSEMELSVAGSDLSGVYRTNVGKPEPTEEFALVGFVTGDVITFTANFGKYGSLSAWAGQHTEPEPGRSAIKALWHLARRVGDASEPQELWSAVVAGANTFSRAGPAG